MEENDIIHTKRELTNLWCDMDKNKDLAMLIDKTINILNDLFYQNQQYKQQIDEAIKYIKENRTTDMFAEHYMLIDDDIEKVINILSKLKERE